MHLPRVIGHRGACGYAPENTLISMKMAKNLGVECVEFDVMLTQCHELVIMHDETLQRTTSGRGHVSQTPYEEIKNLDCGSWFAPEFTHERVPKFAQLLDYLSEINLNMNVEIKPWVGSEIETTIKALQTLNTHWPVDHPMPLISSFSELVLKSAYEAGTSYPLGFIMDHVHDNWRSIVAKYQCISLHTDHKLLTPTLVKKFKTDVSFVLAFTVNSPKRALELFDMGVDAVFSDYPDQILLALGEKS